MSLIKTVSKSVVFWIFTLIFPFIHLYFYLFFSALLATLTFLIFGKVDEFWLTFPPYLIYILILTFFFSKKFKYLKRVAFKNVLLTVIIIVIWFLSYLTYYSGSLVRKNGWLDSTVSVHNKNNWWILNRRSPVYPFDVLGEGLYTSTFTGKPENYLFLGKGDEKTYIKLISYATIFHTIILSGIQGIIYLYLFQKYLKLSTRPKAT